MALIGTIAASTSTTIDLNYCPEVIYFETATVPTELTVVTKGDGVVKKLDGNGITAEANLFQIGLNANSYQIRLTDGWLDKITAITIANATATPISVYGRSENKGSVYFTSFQQKTFAGQSTELTDFSYVGFPSGASSDVMQVTYRSGFTEDIKIAELDAIVGQASNQVRQGLPNFDQSVRKVNFTPNADQNVYIISLARASGAINARS